jgi:DNA-binding MarR family transcriptional regulator
METLVTQITDIKRAHLQTRAFAQARLAKCGLTPSRFEVLRAVQREGGSCAQRVLVQRLAVSPPTVSRLLRALIKLGLIEHRRDAVDARMRNVRLTREGVACADRGSAALLGRLP